MNLQQVKQDVNNGVMVSKVTWLKVLDAALILECANDAIAMNSNESGTKAVAMDAIALVGNISN